MNCDTDTMHQSTEAGPRSETLRLAGPCIQFVTTAAIMALLFGVLVQQGHLVYLWPFTGIQLALLLRSRTSRRQKLLDIGGAAAAMFFTTLLVGMPWWVSSLIALTQVSELWLLLRLMGGRITGLDALKRRPILLRFCLGAIVAPMLPALAAPAFMPGQGSLLQRVCAVAMADSLGIAVLTPACLLLFSREFWRKDWSLRKTWAGSLAFLVFLATGTGIFVQSANPFLFMIFPPLILVVFVLGLEGAVCTSVVTAVVAMTATAYSHGPVWLMPHATMEHRILVLQIFLWTTVATTLPIGSLLDERRAAQREAHTNQTIYRLLLDHAEDMIVLATLDGSSRFVSPAVERVLGWTQQQYAALPPSGRVHPDDEAQVHSVVAGLHRGEADHSMRYRAPTRDGSYRWMHAFVHGYREAEGGPITGYVATIQDISVLKENEDSWSAEKHALASENEQLAELAGRDELTGIANRRTFNQALAIECSRQNRAGDCVSLLMIDVDSFKKFNDCYGHQAGDACLQKVARVLEGCAARSEDLAARFGGEEFAVLLPQTESAAAVRVGQCILDAVRGLRMEHAETAIGYLTVSIGIATWKSGERMSSTQLVEQADAALYESKRAGRDRLTLHPAAAEPGAQRHRATLP